MRQFLKFNKRVYPFISHLVRVWDKGSKSGEKIKTHCKKKFGTWERKGSKTQEKLVKSYKDDRLLEYFLNPAASYVIFMTILLMVYLKINSTADTPVLQFINPHVMIYLTFI